MYFLLYFHLHVVAEIYLLKVSFWWSFIWKGELHNLKNIKKQINGFNVSRSNKQILQTIFQSVLYIIYFLNFNFHFVCLICLQATEGNQGLTNFFVYINYLQTCIRFFLATSSYKCLQNNPVVHVPCKNTTRKILWIFLQIINKSTFNYKKKKCQLHIHYLDFHTDMEC